ncbi:MAG: alkaline phosphatase family protein [Ardenticatenaceae bacterium]|nr:alkaline phosphatase family protein [Ardenticatenaceae bacterium]
MTKKKTLLIGLDAACWAYLDPLLAQGELPNIQRLREAGTWGVLMSTLPALTPAAWSSIITGKNPGKHGIFDMTYRRTDTYEFVPVSAPRRLGTPFWKRLNEQGVRVGLVNLPFTYPPDGLDGFVLAGFGAPGSVPDLAFPREALKWLEDQFGPYQPVVDAEMLRSGDPAVIFAAEKALQDYHVKAACALAEKYDVDVLAINLMMLDHANHKMPQMEHVNQSIRQLDVDLGRLLEAFRPDNVLAISDHGSRRVKGDFLLHAWLRDEGFCVQRKRPSTSRAQTLNWVLAQWLRGHGWHGARELLYRRLLRFVVPRLSAERADDFWERVEADVPFARTHVEYDDELDFEQTRVYPGGSYSGLLYFNLTEREPKGMLSAADAEILASELKQKLMQLTDPETGERLFKNVYTADEVLDGPVAFHGPNIIIDKYASSWNILSTFRRGSYAEKVYGRYFVDNIKDFGHHSRDGIFVFAGSDFQSGALAEPGVLMDVPATLLHLYDVPLPDDWDGRSLTETMTPEFRDSHPVQQQPGDIESGFETIDLYSDAQTEEIIDHLRALGYLD